MTRKFVSSGAHFCAVIATMNLVLMAAIANDESVGNRTSSSVSSTPGSNPPGIIGGPPPSRALPSLSALAAPPPPPPPRALPLLSPPTPTASAPHYPVTPSIQSLVRSQSFDYSVVASSTNTNKPAGGTTFSSSKNMNQSLSSFPPVTPIPLTMARSSQNAQGSPSIYHYNSTISSSSGLSSSSSFDNLMNSSMISPFVTLNSTVLRAQYKSNAMLPCNVRNSGDGVTVSWIRKKDYHLLTVGLQTYSSDDRFSAIHAQSPDDWTLKIKYVQPRDAGIYECQVSTHPPSSIFVTLLVVEARAEIVGGPEKFYKAGSSVELRCDLIDSTEEPEYVFWYQGLRMINYDPSRHINVTHSKTSSMLVIHNVQKTDSGNYTCVPSNAHPASIFVHIINGENPAAMQHGSHSTTCVPCPPLWCLSFLLSLTLQTFYLHFLSRNVDHNHHHHHQSQNNNRNQKQNNDDKEKQQYDEQKTGDNNDTSDNKTTHEVNTCHHHNHSSHHCNKSLVLIQTKEEKDEQKNNGSFSTNQKLEWEELQIYLETGSMSYEMDDDDDRSRRRRKFVGVLR